MLYLVRTGKEVIGFMTRITKAPEERRQEIIDTAMKVFYEKGYEKTSISDIAREMNVAQGLCYRYFSSKEELFDTALDQYAGRQVEQISTVLDEQMSLADIIEKMPTFAEVENDNSYAQKICSLSCQIYLLKQMKEAKFIYKIRKQQRPFAYMDSWAFCLIRSLHLKNEKNVFAFFC